jgi:hypothetical protein
MTTLDVKVSFYDADEPAFDAVLSVTSTDLTIEVDDRLVGAWPAGQVSLAVSDDSIVVSVEGERLLVESVDTAALRDAFGLLDVDLDGAQRHLGGAPRPY